jgi:DNA ligase-1
MRQFAILYQRLDETTKTNEKLQALRDYFAEASSDDAAYALFFLLGNKLKPSLPTKVIRKAAALSANVPDWLFEETYQWVGDLAETAASMAVGIDSVNHETLKQTVSESIIPLLNRANDSKKRSRKSSDQKPTEQLNGRSDCGGETGDALVQRLMYLWSRHDQLERFVFNKLLTGNLRVGVSAKLVIKALSLWCGVAADELSHRLMGNWEPSRDFFDQLIDANYRGDSPAKPYPFCLAHPFPENQIQEHLVIDYMAEWKWDGIRAQLIRRCGRTFLWSRGEELLDGRFPEIELASQNLPDGLVLDGEILAFADAAPLPFTLLQKRIQRKKPGTKIQLEVPVVFMAFDILEHEGKDLRSETFDIRRKTLDTLELGKRCNSRTIRSNEVFLFEDWKSFFVKKDQARRSGAEGLMLKHKHGKYEVGRVTGVWWKAKVNPYTVDAVLVYAQRGHGRRAGLFSDYTFALWDKDQLVPFAKAYSGLTNEELAKVDRWIKENTVQRFGPVHEVPAHIVMELAFENIQESNRHKSGIAVRFPRILRWRHDKLPSEADQLDVIKQMLKRESQG